ncbi:MAG: hypothetical protein GC152_02360 [Alphaproteobacteria bacterium]|nr:hypothetical protein [Alphaproteobacteria bacterium]
MAGKSFKVDGQIALLAFALRMHKPSTPSGPIELHVRVRDVCDRAWREALSAEKAPVQPTFHRWYRGETGIGPENLKGLQLALKWIADGRIPFEAVDLTRPVHELAVKYGVSLDDFHAWLSEAEAERNGGAPDPRRERDASIVKDIGGVSLCYRHHTHPKFGDLVRRTAMVVVARDPGPGVEIQLVGPTGKVWSGEIVRGQDTYTAIVERRGETGGWFVNTITLATFGGSKNVRSGFRTRISDDFVRYLSSYRLLCVRRPDLDPILDSDDYVSSLQGLCHDVSLSAKPSSDAKKKAYLEIDKALNADRPRDPSTGELIGQGSSVLVYFFDPRRFDLALIAADPAS